MRCGFINEDDSSFLCERCNNNQPFQCEIDTKDHEDGEIPIPPGEESGDEEWVQGSDEEETEKGDGEDGREEGGNGEEEEWDDAPPEPGEGEKETIVAPPQDTCPKCSRKTKEHWTNCAYCGTRLGDDSSRKCPNCGKPLKKGWSLCAYCGKKF